MRNERLQWGLIAVLSIILVSLMIFTKKPLCIESSVVEKIDRVTYGKKETIYRCSADQIIPYSNYFAKNKSSLEQRIEGVSQFLNKIEPIKNKFTLVIDETRPISFSIAENKIIMGSSFLEAEGHLERAIIKLWLSDKVSQKVDVSLFSEVTADFLLFSYSGSFDVEDPLLKIKTKIGNIRWPQVLKSKESYCESPWKLSEHYSLCETMQPALTLTDQTILNLSLRPLLTSVWINSFSELSFYDQISFLNHFSDFLRSQRLTSEKAIEMILTEAHPLKQGVMNIKKVTDLMYSSPLVQERLEYRKFYAGLTHNLQQAGLNDSFAEAYFDYLVEYPDALSYSSIFFKSLAAVAQKNPQLQIAVKDQSQIWILPSKSSLPLKTFDQIKSQQHIFLACPSLKEIHMDQFFNQAEKLLLVKGCDQDKAIDFDSLITGGAQKFSRKNKNLAFIQFHLPSFEMKAKELSHVKNFFELVKNRDVTKSEFQTLGWSQIQWYEDSQAYKPNAVIDAIELFRTDIN